MVPVNHPCRNARRGVAEVIATWICGTSATHMSGQSPKVGTDTKSSSAASADRPRRTRSARCRIDGEATPSLPQQERAARDGLVLVHGDDAEARRGAGEAAARFVTQAQRPCAAEG